MSDKDRGERSQPFFLERMAWVSEERCNGQFAASEIAGSLRQTFSRSCVEIRCSQPARLRQRPVTFSRQSQLTHRDGGFVKKTLVQFLNGEGLIQCSDEKGRVAIAIATSSRE